MKKMMRREHPMPQFYRKDWENLNGKWEFFEDYSVSGAERDAMNDDFKYPEKINVPFCRESILSGLGHTDFCESVWYRRKISIPDAQKGKRALLHIGACDYRTSVYVNGKKATEHIGGYVPVVSDITDLLTDGENTVVIHALDFLRSKNQPGGKQSQRYASHGCSYTRTTGIWQTVWIEYVSPSYIKSYKAYPSVEYQKVSLHVEAVNADGMSVYAVASYKGKEMGRAASMIEGKHATLEIELNSLHLWEIGNGRLYDLELMLANDSTETFGDGASFATSNDATDCVKSYFGMRSVSMKDGALLLNGKKVFQRLVLDQGFYPDGIYTARDDSELLADIKRSVACGFHGARLHQKIFEPRFLYHCDKEGYIVWGEHGNWGLDISRPEAWQAFFPEWVEAVERDFNHPAIIGWCPLNETQFDQSPDFVKALAALTRALDPTRLYIDASGWTHIEGVTDMMDLHDYEQDPVKFAERLEPMKNGDCIELKRSNIMAFPTFVSEYGGIRWPVDSGNGWGYGQSVKDEEDFKRRFIGLANVLLDHPKITGLCYTQLTDVEQEINGLYYYDRTPKFDFTPFREVLTKKAAIEE